jgi:hypothetical protein
LVSIAWGHKLPGIIKTNQQHGDAGRENEAEIPAEIWKIFKQIPRKLS